ncbi:hypothetical protein RUND412_002895 [Rhizina undulata]
MSSIFGSWSVSKIPDLSHKVFLVTGGSTGLGFGCITHLLQHNPAKILFLSDKEEHAKLAQGEWGKYGDPERVHWIQCNLQDLKDVDRTAKRLRESEDRLDALIANAGIGVGAYNLSNDGIETHFQVNHLSQMHLILSLMPVFVKTAKTYEDSRIVLQSSDLHKAAPGSIKFANIDEINTNIGPAFLYNRSKLAQLLFMRTLVQRLADGRIGEGTNENLFVLSTHPGAVSTMQQKQAEEAYGTVAKIAVAMARPLMRDPNEDGPLPMLFAATSPEVKEKKLTGTYITPPGNVSEPTNQAQDDALAENLWTLSENLLKEKLGADAVNL